MNAPTLETERLLLRPPSEADTASHAEMMADPLTAEFITLDGKPQDPANAWRTWAMVNGHWRLKGYGFFSIIDQRTGLWAGRAGPWFPEGWPGLEIGWGVHPAFRGRGYALEAAVETARWTLRTLKPPSLLSVIRPNNANSRRVAEKFGETLTSQCDLYGRPADVWTLSKERFEELWGPA